VYVFVWNADEGLLREGRFDLGVLLKMERNRKEERKRGNQDMNFESRS